MKKIVFGLLIALCCTNLSAYGTEPYVFTAGANQNSYVKSLQKLEIPTAKYLKYYNVHPGVIDAEFVYLSDNDEERFLKTLKKQEREEYKYVKKVQKQIKKEKWNTVFEKYPDFFPAYLQYYKFSYAKGDYDEALRMLHKIKAADRTGEIFNSELINYSFANLYLLTGQYTAALNYYKLYENKNDDFVNSSIANCYYALGKYSEAITYAKKIREVRYEDKELLYSAYKSMKNYTEAHKYAQELLNEKYCFENLMKMQATVYDTDLKLSYLYKAKEITTDENYLYEANKIIALLEQKKLENAASKTTQFVKIPKWKDYESRLVNCTSKQELSAKQSEFFQTANKYISTYKGQQLTNAFNSLSQEYETYVHNKQNQYYMEQQAKAQQALLEEQQRSNILREQLLREQQINNALERQRIYYMHRSYYMY